MQTMNPTPNKTPTATSSGFLPPMVQAGLLIMIAGYADAIGFLQFRAFAGQMTGNTILLAISLVQSSWSEAGFYVAVIACFLVGVVIAGGLVRFGTAPAVALCFAAIALAACAFATDHWGALLLAFAMGTQNATVTRFGAATLNTVFITGDLQRLFEKVLAWLWRADAEQPTSGLGTLALVWVEYFAGALLGAAAHAMIPHALLIPAAIVPLVLLGRPGKRR
jgi:uncharacterized membrane protein YoaK (UPF0700 family)